MTAAWYHDTGVQLRVAFDIAADRVLAANGWTRTTNWNITDDAAYATVERKN